MSFYKAQTDSKVANSVSKVIISRLKFYFFWLVKWKKTIEKHIKQNCKDNKNNIHRCRKKKKKKKAPSIKLMNDEVETL